MNILQKTLLILGVFFVFLLLVFYISSRTILLGSYEALEKESARRNLERATNALERELKEIDRFTADWAHWDDTYAFINDPAGGKRYRENNLVDSTFSDGEFNYILYFDLAGRLIYGRGFDLEAGAEAPIPDEVSGYFAATLPRILEPGAAERRDGLLMTAAGPLFFAARPILTSEKKGPARGWLAMARYLGSDLRDRLQDITQLELAFYPSGEELPEGLPAPAEITADGLPTILVINRDQLAVYRLLVDVSGGPGLVLEVRLPRPITRQGMHTLHRYFTWLLFVSASALLVMALSLHRLIIRPLRRLIREIGRIGEAGSFSARLPKKGRGEAGRLAGAINRMLEALEKITADLRRSEEMYRGVVEDQTEMICRFRLDGRLVFSNQAFTRASDGNGDHSLARSFYDRFSGGDRDSLRETLAGLPGGRESFTREFTVASGGSERIEQWTFRQLGGGGSTGDEIQAVGRDVTRRRELKERLFKAHKLESLGTLAGGIAHDFNNVLTAILGNISLARTWSKPETTPISEVLAAAETACLKARGLTNQLLTFSSGGRPVKRPILLGPVIEQAARMALSGSTAKGVFRISEDFWPFEGDEAQIGQVVHNLVLNAAQAMPAGGEIEIAGENLTVSAGEGESLSPGPYVKITVRDQGIGIPEDIRGRIFDPYFTTKQVGSGLGLAIVYSIVRNHGGEISAESSPGRGSTFTVILPASPGKEVRPADITFAPLRGEEKILVMDDEEGVRRVASLMLADLGYSPVAVEDSGEMIEVYRRAADAGAPFDAVIIDLTIRGGMGGVEANRELLRYDPEAVTIVTSGYSSNPVMDRYREFGFRGVIPKPYRLDQLGEVLSSVLKTDQTG